MSYLDKNLLYIFIIFTTGMFVRLVNKVAEFDLISDSSGISNWPVNGS